MSNTNTVMDAIETILAWDLPDASLAEALATQTSALTRDPVELTELD